MGSLRALVLIASLAACETSGMEVVVLPPAEGGPSPDQIRLFIGQPPDIAVSIAPEGFTLGQQRSGYRWVRDPNNSADLLDVSPGDSVSFSFVSDGDLTELGAIIAVGYTNGVPTSAGSLFHKKTGVGNVRVFELPLYPAVDPRVASNRTALLQLELWGPNPGDESCVHLLNKRPDRDLVDEHDSAFIVANGDQDCDGYADDDPVLECAPEVHDATVPPHADDLACALKASLNVTGDRACVLGGPRCKDGGGKDLAECSPSRFCSPESVCTACQTLAGAAAEACIADPLSHAPASVNMAAIECQVATRVDNTGVKLCGDTMSVPLPVPARMPALQCGNAKITAAGQPLSDRIQVGTARVDVKANSACEFELTASGEAGPILVVGQSTSGLVTLELDNFRGLALPVQLQLRQPSDCTEPGYCVIIGDAADRPSLCLDMARPTPP